MTGPPELTTETVASVTTAGVVSSVIGTTASVIGPLAQVVDDWTAGPMSPLTVLPTPVTRMVSSVT